MTQSTQGQPVSLRGVEKTFNGVKVLTDISLEITAGEFISLLGPSGSGKSTILLSIAGFVQPSAGEIHAGDRRIDTLPPEQRNLGVVFQGYALFPHMTVTENLAYPLAIRRMSRAQIEERVNRTLDLVQLTSLKDRRPGQLSGGQQQRVALARALVFDPAVVLLDEPLSALDKQLRLDLQLELKSLHTRLGTTFLNVTHDQEEAMAMSDRIVVLKSGVIVQQGSAQELYDRPNSRFVAEFFGRTFFIEGRRSGSGGVIETALGALRVAVAGRPKSSTTIALRPERVRMLKSGEGADNVIDGSVTDTSFLGGDSVVQIETLIGRMSVRQSTRGISLPAVGETVQLGWSVGDEIIVEN